MKFTQFMRPDGRKLEIAIDLSPELEAMGAEMSASKVRFEAEVLRTGEVSLEICREDSEGENETLAMSIAPNGPGVLKAIEALVREAHQAWKEAS
jgi:4-hydroxyphenylpyruvate dioxygenase-like putative hemolysin